MLARDSALAVDLTDIARFTGRAARVLGASERETVSLGICSTSAARLDECALFSQLNAVVGSVSSHVVWLVTDCDPALAGELAKWCERRELFWHYCHGQRTFALTAR